jgi:hypothetical protein
LIRSLRKGHDTVDFQYEHGCDTIDAEKYEAEVKDGFAVVRFSLHPSDGNQRDDEDNLHTHELFSVDITDSYVVERLSNFLRARKHEYSRWRLEVLSRGKMLRFAITPKLVLPGHLELTVLRTGG